MTSLPSPSQSSYVRESDLSILDTTAHTARTVSTFNANNVSLTCDTKNPNINTHEKKSVLGKDLNKEIVAMKETENRVTEILSTVFSPFRDANSNLKSDMGINSNLNQNNFEDVIDESFFHRDEHEKLIVNLSRRREEILVLFLNILQCLFELYHQIKQTFC